MITLIVIFNSYHYYLSYAGPFQDLNAEHIQDEVDGMFRTMYKLARSFGDQPGPQRIANNVKGKIDKFKAHLPMLGVICNPGIRDRHWERVRRVFLNLSMAWGIFFLFFLALS